MNPGSEPCHLMTNDTALKKLPVYLSWEQWLILLSSSSCKLFFPILPSWSCPQHEWESSIVTRNRKENAEIPEIITKVL